MVSDAIAQYKTYIMTETLAVGWGQADKAFEAMGEVDGESSRVGLAKDSGTGLIGSESFNRKARV